MSASNDDRELWRTGPFSCVMVSCCAGAELQVRRSVGPADDEEIVLRELYPTKSDLYERARALEADYADSPLQECDSAIECLLDD